MRLEQAANQDHQEEAQEQSGELLPGPLCHRQEQRVADRDRIGELDQPIGPPWQELNVRRTEDGAQIKREDAEKAGEMSRPDEVSPPPQKKHSGNAGRHGRKWHLGGDIDGVVGIDAEHEQADQGTVESVETGLGALYDG
jgi:hypothetical protein